LSSNNLFRFLNYTRLRCMSIPTWLRPFITLATRHCDPPSNANLPTRHRPGTPWLGLSSPESPRLAFAVRVRSDWVRAFLRGHSLPSMSAGTVQINNSLVISMLGRSRVSSCKNVTVHSSRCMINDQARATPRHHSCAFRGVATHRKAMFDGKRIHLIASSTI